MAISANISATMVSLIVKIPFEVQSAIFRYLSLWDLVLLCTDKRLQVDHTYIQKYLT